METTEPESITSGTDLFFCKPYNCKLLARICVERQAKFEAGIDRTALRQCGDCALGRQVKELSGVVIDPASLVKGWKRPSSFAGFQQGSQPKTAPGKKSKKVNKTKGQELEPIEPGKVSLDPEVVPTSSPATKNLDAVKLGRLGGLKGGPARVANMSAEQLTNAASKAATIRWHGAEDVEAPATSEPLYALVIPMTEAELKRVTEAAKKDGALPSEWSKEALLGIAHMAVDDPLFRMAADGKYIEETTEASAPHPITRVELQKALIMCGRMGEKEEKVTDADMVDWSNFWAEYDVEVLALAFVALGRVESQHDLTATQKRILGYLYETPQRTVRDVADKLGLKYHSTHGSMTVLEGLRLIRRENDANRAATVWSVTDLVVDE